MTTNKQKPLTKESKTAQGPYCVGQFLLNMVDIPIIGYSSLKKT